LCNGVRTGLATLFEMDGRLAVGRVRPLRTRSVGHVLGRFSLPTRLLLGLLACVALLVGMAGAASAATRVPEIVGGSPAQITAYPWMASLDISTDVGGEAFCGGTVIGARWVLTAAHCIDLSDLHAQVTRVDVVVGQTNLDSSSGVKMTADRLVINPSWDPDTLGGDFALLRLSRPAPVRALRLVGPDENALWAPGTTATVVGWGLTSPNGSLASSLRQASMPIVADDACGSPGEWGSLFDPATMVCVGLGKAGVGSCQGDSGGPLLVPDRLGDWVEVGINSWGADVCADPTLPDVFARLGTLTPAIVAVLQADPVAPVGLPQISTGSARSVTAQTATVAGMVSASGLGTDYRIEYGPTQSYSSTAGGYADDGTSQRPLSIKLAKLAPSTTYHYRIAAVNAAGSATGGDETFTTKALVGLGRPSRHSGYVLQVPVTCNEPSNVACTGELRVTATSGRRTLATGTARLSRLNGQKTTALLVQLTSKTDKPLPAGKTTITVTFAASAAGVRQTISKQTTL